MRIQVAGLDFPWRQYDLPMSSIPATLPPMSLEFYRIIHVAGILMLFSGLSALLGLYTSGHSPRKGLRITLAVIHGIGMALVLVSGFGQLARLGLTGGLPGWIYAKLGIWLILGGSMLLARRKAQWGTALIGFWVALGAIAACLATFKPF